MKVKKITDVKFASRLFEPVDVDRMIKTGSELVRKDPSLIVVFYGKDEKTARIVVMAGKDAVARGVDSRQIANEAASKLGGGGSGRADFAQGGGAQTDKLLEAIEIAEKTLRKQMKTDK